ncbi:MAG: hypothetical protein MI741_02190 [Rhodospirillales bacterium]|nr:hypothetical protein [Rhodospirillales bacterium]
MKLRLPAHTTIAVSLPNSSSNRRKKFRRLARAIDEMQAGFEHQQQEVRAFQQTLHSLEQRILATSRHLLAYSESLDKIQMARLGRKSRQLASMMNAYSAGS